MIERLGGRKFVFALVLTLLFGGFVLTGHMTVDEFTTAAIWVFGLFSGANALGKLTLPSTSGM